MNIKIYPLTQLLFILFLTGVTWGQCPNTAIDDYGDCEMLIGWTWNGSDCAYLSGCGTTTSNGDDNAEWFYSNYDECFTFCDINNLPGDVNYDGNLDVIDIVLIVGYIIGNNIFTEDQISVGDYSDDGLLNVVDIVSLVNIILNGFAQRHTWEIISEDILEPNCAAACHASGTFFAEQSDLILTPNVAYDQLIERIPQNESAWADGLVLLSSIGGQPAEIQIFYGKKLICPIETISMMIIHTMAS